MRASATFPLMVIAGGLAFFHERPSIRQWMGVLSTVAGLIEPWVVTS